ncbi:MAG: hypothetical protein U0992_07500 [Planctomycetaceae bacterium]
MKLLRVSLLVLFSFAAGLVVYRMATKPLPSLRLEWPTAAYSVELTTDQAAPVPFAPPASPSINETRVAVPLADDIVLSNVKAFDIQVAGSSTSIGLAESSPAASRDIAFGVEPTPLEGDPEAPGEPQRRDNSTIADPTDAAQEIPNPEPAITAIGVDGGVRLQLEDGSSIEAERIVLDQANTFAIGQGELVADIPQPALRAATDSDAANPIPEFLRELSRNGELPPLIAGQKVVTVHVSVDNWLDRSCWGIHRADREAGGGRVVLPMAESPHVPKVLGINPVARSEWFSTSRERRRPYATINVVPLPQIGAAATDSSPGPRQSYVARPARRRFVGCDSRATRSRTHIDVGRRTQTHFRR